MATPINQAKRRATDEKHLDWLRRWVRGETMTEIAHQWGVTRAAVSLAIKDIMVADIAEEGGESGVVLAYRGKNDHSLQTKPYRPHHVSAGNGGKAGGGRPDLPAHFRAAGCRVDGCRCWGKPGGTGAAVAQGRGGSVICNLSKGARTTPKEVGWVL